MIAKLIHVLLRLASLLNNDVFTVNIQKRSQYISHFLTSNPFARVHKGSRLVSDIHQHLLNLFSHSPFDDYLRNGRNAHIHVMIQRKEREKALQRAIRAAPALVVQSLMPIVEIEDVSTDQPAGFDDGHGFVRIAENARNEAKPMKQRCIACDVLSGEKQRIGISEIGTIGSKSEAMIPRFSPLQFGVRFPGFALRSEFCKV